LKVLSFTNHFESGAALLNRGVTTAASEERFSRVKNQGGHPKQAIEWLLKDANIELRDLDKIYYCSIGYLNPDTQDLKDQSSRLASCDDVEKQIFLERLTTETLYNQKAFSDLEDWRLENRIDSDMIECVDHHESHARAALLVYKVEDNAKIFTCDGKGGFNSSVCWSYANGELKSEGKSTSFDSLGYFYGNVTIGLGFKAERHEGKITGLAAFGSPKKELVEKLNVFRVEHGKIVTSNILGRYIPFFIRDETKWDITQFEEVLRDYSKEDIAAASQQILEDTVTDWIESNLVDSDKHIYLSGGIFANVKLNQRIQESLPNIKINVCPPMGDTGLCLGGLHKHISKEPKKIKFPKLPGMFLGPKFEDTEIADKLNERGYGFFEMANAGECVDLLMKAFSRNEPVGIFSGSMEFGPRALCHRTILFTAVDKSINDSLNKRLNRTEFMPFAPVVLDSLVPQCFLGDPLDSHTSSYMTITYDCTQEFKETAPAVVHVDGTARPQVLTQDADPRMYELLREYCEKTGELCLVNTSFNNHESPIVCSVEDALDSLELNNVDHILFNHRYWISRK